MRKLYLRCSLLCNLSSCLWNNLGSRSLFTDWRCQRSDYLSQRIEYAKAALALLRIISGLELVQVIFRLSSKAFKEEIHVWTKSFMVLLIINTLVICWNLGLLVFSISCLWCFFVVYKKRLYRNQLFWVFQFWRFELKPMLGYRTLFSLLAFLPGIRPNLWELKVCWSDQKLIYFFILSNILFPCVLVAVMELFLNKMLISSEKLNPCS